MKIISMTLMAISLSACASFGDRSRGDNIADTWTGSYTIVGPPGGHCSMIVKNEDQEGLLTSLASPFLVNLVSGGLDSLGKAIADAGSERSKSYASPQSDVVLANVQNQRNSVFPENIEIKRQRVCVRTIYGQFKLSEGSVDADTRFNQLGEENYANGAALRKAVEGPINANIPGSISEIHLYTEHLLEPFNGANKTPYYKVHPIILYYPSAISGSRYRLASMTLTLRAPGTEADKAELSFSQTFAPNAISPGSLYTFKTGGLVPSGLLPAPAFSKSEADAISAISSARKTIITANEVQYLEHEGHLSGYQDSTLETEQLKANVKLKKCKAVAKSDSFKLDLCEQEAEIEMKEQQDINAVLTKARRDRSKLDLSTMIQSLGTKVGVFNANLSITETREANEFYVTIGEALKSSKTEQKTAITNYVNSQLGLTADASNLPAQNTYRLSKLEYDIAFRKHEEAVVNGDQSTIDQTLITLVQKYNSLTISAEAVGQPISVPAPY